MMNMFNDIYMKEKVLTILFNSITHLFKLIYDSNTLRLKCHV